MNNKVLLCDRKRRTASCVACPGGGRGRGGGTPAPPRGGGTCVLPGVAERGRGGRVRTLLLLRGREWYPCPAWGRKERERGMGWEGFPCPVWGGGRGIPLSCLRGRGGMGTPCLPTPPPLPVTRQDTSENT